MIVCICRAVSDRVIKSAIASGAGSVAEVGQACRAGTCCGTCRPSIAHLIYQLKGQAQGQAQAQMQPQQGAESCGESGCDRRAA